MKNNFVVVGTVGSGRLYEDGERKDLFFFHMYVYVAPSTKKRVRVYLKKETKISNMKDKIVKCVGHIEGKDKTDTGKMYMIADTVRLVMPTKFENTVDIEGLIAMRPFYSVKDGKGLCMLLIKAGSELLHCSITGERYDEMVSCYTSKNEVAIKLHADANRKGGKTCLELTQ